MKKGNEQSQPLRQKFVKQEAQPASLTAMVDGVELQVKEAHALSPMAYQGY
jgi:hypothetical protein